MKRSTKDLENSARIKPLTRTGLSKEEQKYLDQFNTLGISIDSANSDGSLRVDFPNDKVDEFIKIWSKNVSPGYWGEYVGSKTGFIFKLPDGEFEHIVLTDNDSQTRINKKMQIYIPSWRIDQDLWQWIYSCDIYTEWI